MLSWSYTLDSVVCALPIIGQKLLRDAGNTCDTGSKNLHLPWLSSFYTAQALLAFLFGLRVYWHFQIDSGVIVFTPCVIPSIPGSLIQYFPVYCWSKSRP